MVANMEKSLDFYVKGLGFELTMEWKPEGKIAWCWLEKEGVAVMLQEHSEANRPKDKPGVGFSVCFMCQDALALFDEFRKRNLTPAEPFVGNNLWVVSLRDPDGYHLAFESPTDVPEETTYTDWIKKKS